MGGFRNSPEWIADRLLPAGAPEEVRESLKLLLEAGLVKRTPGGYKAVDEAITTDDEVMSVLARNYHLRMLDRAKEALDTLDPDQRDISSVCFKVREADFPKLKKQIQLIRKELRGFAVEGNEQKVTTTFTIDYASEALPKGTPTVTIDRFWFNVVGANYRTVEDTEGRIWKVPDSLGRLVDFTGRDTAAVLPPVAVPEGEWTILKLESRIPTQATLRPDTLEFLSFADRGYIRGTYSHGGAYDLKFIFHARRWVASADFFSAETFRDRLGREAVLIDQDHNLPLYGILSENFFKSFNSWKVWKGRRKVRCGKIPRSGNETETRRSPLHPLASATG